MYFGGLRVGETLGLRLSDLHFAERSGALGCSYPGAHLHVVPRANVNGARVFFYFFKVPVEGSLVGAFDHYLRRERDACAAAAGCDFVFVNLWGEPVGTPMKVSRVHKLIRSLSAHAGLERPVHPHMLRHSAGTAWAAAEGDRRGAGAARARVAVERRCVSTPVGGAPARRGPEDGRAVRRRPHPREGSMTTAVAASREAPSLAPRREVELLRGSLDEQLLAELGWDPEPMVVRAVLGHPSFGFRVCEVPGCELPGIYRGNVCTTCHQRFTKSVAAGRCSDLEEFKRIPC